MSGFVGNLGLRSTVQARKSTPLPLHHLASELPEISAQLHQNFDLLSGQHGGFLISETASTTATAVSKLNWNLAASSSLVLTSFAAALYLWDQAYNFASRNIPFALRPVLGQAVKSVGVAGISGIFWEAVLNFPALDAFSKSVLNLKLADLDKLNETFLQVVVALFVSNILMICLGWRPLQDMDRIAAEMELETGTYSLAEKFSKYIPVLAQEQPGYKNVRKEIFRKKDEWAAKTLLLENHMLQVLPSPPRNFRIEPVLEVAFSDALQDVLRVSPWTWATLLPELAVVNTIDFAHKGSGVGFFFTTSSFILPITIATIVASAWGYWNAWKMTQVKSMLLPRLVPENSLDPGGARILSGPAIYNDGVRTNFYEVSTPTPLAFVESVFGKPPETIYDDLFGKAGSNGLAFYENSIRNQVWLSLTQLVILGTQILPDDLQAIYQKTGNVRAAQDEFLFLGFLLLWHAFQIFIVAPRTVWNYAVVSSMEETNLNNLLDRSGYGLYGGFMFNDPSGRVPGMEYEGDRRYNKGGDLMYSEPRAGMPRKEYMGRQ